MLFNIYKSKHISIDKNKFSSSWIEFNNNKYKFMFKDFKGNILTDQEMFIFA